MNDTVNSQIEAMLAESDKATGIKATGIEPPRGFMTLDAGVLDMQEEHEIRSEDIKLNHIEFVFPDGMNKVDIFKECRAITKTDDFDAMYDYTMESLVGKPVHINIKQLDGTKREIAAIQIVDKGQNLRGYDIIDEYPVIITWLVEFVAATLSKKYPPLGIGVSQAQVAQGKTATKSKKAQKGMVLPKVQ
jgi:hypothetical protein